MQRPVHHLVVTSIFAVGRESFPVLLYYHCSFQVCRQLCWTVSFPSHCGTFYLRAWSQKFPLHDTHDIPAVNYLVGTGAVRLVKRTRQSCDNGSVSAHSVHFIQTIISVLAIGIDLLNSQTMTLTTARLSLSMAGFVGLQTTHMPISLDKPQQTLRESHKLQDDRNSIRCPTG